MKVLVVDDELLTREAIVKSLRNSGYNDIMEAEDGLHALEAIKITCPDIVISDIKMPEMDGIKLLTETRKNNGNIVFIIISGYDLFEYAQSALKNGAFSYILKPIKDYELNEVMSLASAKVLQDKKVRELNSLTKIKANQGIELLQKQFLLELLNESSLSPDYIEKKSQELNIIFQYDSFCVAVIRIDNYSSLAEKLDINGRHLYKFSIENIASEIFTSLGIIPYTFPLEDGQGFILNFNESDFFNSSDNAYNTFFLVKESIKAAMNFTVTIGTSKVISSLESFNNAYEAAVKAANMRLVKGENQVFIYEAANNPKSITKPIDLKVEQDLLLCFEKCDRPSGLKVIEDIYSQLKESNIIDIDIVIKLNFQVILLIYKILNQLHIDAEEMFGNEYALYNQVNKCSSLDSILSWFDEKLEKCIEKISADKHKGNTSIMDKAIEYIHDNFNRDISLEMVANHIHMSPSYCSKQFKREFGEAFVDYLIRYRISKARVYLKEGIYKANEVSRMVGFNDDKYFYKTFKKYTGLTPGEYKGI